MKCCALNKLMVASLAVTAGLLVSHHAYAYGGRGDGGWGGPRVGINLGFGPGYYGYPAYGYYPYYAAPPPTVVYAAPPPVYVAPAQTVIYSAPPTAAYTQPAPVQQTAPPATTSAYPGYIGQ